MSIESIAGENEINAGLIPTHPSITLGCGFMMKTDWENFSDLVKILEEKEIRYRSLFYSIKIGIKRETKLLHEEEEDR